MEAMKLANDEGRVKMMRHSGAHLLAAAIKSLYPTAKFGVGPATEMGFFYDVELPEPIREADFGKLEQKINELRNRKLPIERREVDIDDAISFMVDENQPYKVELLRLLKERGSTAVRQETEDEGLVEDVPIVTRVTLYRLLDFVDLCRGPHVADTSQIGAIKIRNVAGAYWRGDETRPQLQRVHALCFDTRKELEEALWRLEQAALRDHRRLGRELKLFAFSADVGQGLPLWLPNGTVIRSELERLATQEERRDGYQRVATPHLTKEDLYLKSGHLPYYAADMYAPIEIDAEKYYLRPMNCPHHHQIYLSRPWSYRDLPVRLTEYGQVYRYEPSGSLSGLMRVRGFCQNDAHIYCREDQAGEEFLAVMRLHARYYELLGIRDYWMRLSLPDLNNLKKYVDDEPGWLRSLAILRDAMRDSGYPFKEVAGEAAFYGPKVDFMIRSVIGTEYAISTNQLDFLATRRFDLTYVSNDGSRRPVYVIHRAPLGSHERFTAFLIEQFGGAFPTWLAPVQVVIIPVSERHHRFARDVYRQIFDAPVETATGGIRVEIDLADERMQKKIRNAQEMRIPYMLVVGDKEEASSTVNVRHRDGTVLGTVAVDTFIEQLRRQIQTRTDRPPS